MDQLKKYHPIISSALDDILKNRHTNSRFETEALKHLVDFAKRGKLIRGSVICSVAEQLGQNNGDAVKAAVAMELVHSALLMHDDIMDKDRTRRGKPSTYIFYGEKHGRHYGISMAMTLGDIAFFIAIDLLSEINHRAVSIFSKEIVKVGFGQMEDLTAPHEKTITEEQILEFYRLKTARYTFCLPMILGALIAGNSYQELESIGDTLGILFQIRDDYLGVFGDEQETGKPVGSDIALGKKTLIYFRLLDKMTLDEKALLDSLPGDKRIVYADQLLERYNIQKEVLDYIEELRTDALDKMKGNLLEPFLTQLLKYILERKK